MRRYLFAAGLVAALIIDSRFTFAGARLNLPAIFVYMVGLRHGPLKGLAFGLGVGVLGDALADNMLGPNMLGSACVGYLASFLRLGFFTWTPTLGAVGLFALTILDSVLVSASTGAFSSFGLAAHLPLWMLIVQGLVNSPAGAFIRPQGLGLDFGQRH